MQHIPLAAIVHRQPGEVAGEAALVPGLAIAVPLDVLDPRGRMLDHRQPDTRKVACCYAHATRAAWRAEPVDGDVGAAFRADGPPDEFAHQVGIAPARRPLDHPAEEIAVRRYVMEAPAVRSIALLQ